MARKNRFLGWMVCAGLLLGTWGWHCKSDPAVKAPVAGDAAAGVGGENAGGFNTSTVKVSPEERQKIEPALVQLRKLETEYQQLSRQFESMRDEVKKLPASYKKKAKDFDLLKANLDQFEQSNDYIKTELAKLMLPMEARLEPEKSQEATKTLVTANDAAELASNWEDQMGVLERTILDFGQSLGKVEAAVEKLKNARGAPVVLFE